MISTLFTNYRYSYHRYYNYYSLKRRRINNYFSTFLQYVILLLSFCHLFSYNHTNEYAGRTTKTTTTIPFFVTASTTYNNYKYNPYQYDMTVPQFTPDGRLLQVEYAYKAVTEQSTSPIIIIKLTNDLTIIICIGSTSTSSCTVGSNNNNNNKDTNNNYRNKHNNNNSNVQERLLILSNNNNDIIIGLSGVIADSYTLVQQSLLEGNDNIMKLIRQYGIFHKQLTSYKVALMIANQCQQHSFGGGIRPYGSSCLVLSNNNNNFNNNNFIVLYQTDPSGAVQEIILQSSFDNQSDNNNNSNDNNIQQRNIYPSIFISGNSDSVFRINNNNNNNDDTKVMSTTTLYNRLQAQLDEWQDERQQQKVLQNTNTDDDILTSASNDNENDDTTDSTSTTNDVIITDREMIRTILLLIIGQQNNKQQKKTSVVQKGDVAIDGKQHYQEQQEQEEELDYAIDTDKNSIIPTMEVILMSKKRGGIIKLSSSNIESILFDS